MSRRFADIGGTVLHYALRSARSGAADAPVLVCLNSLGTDMRIWDGVAAHFPDHQVLRLDKRGHGLSSGTAESITQLAQDVAALMDQHGLRDAVVCGISVGGMIAQSLAVQRADLVSKLVLCCTGMRIGSPEMWNSRIAAVESEGLESIADAVMGRWFAPSYKSKQPNAWHGYRAMLSRTPAEGYTAVCRAIRDIDLTSAAGALAMPTLVVAGSFDLSTPVETVQSLADALPNTKLHVFDDVGHLPCLEVPDALAMEIKSFQEQHP